MKLFGLKFERAHPERRDAVPPAGSELRMSPENPNFNLSDPSHLAVFQGESGYGGQIAVTPRSSLQTAAVYACIRIISEAVASLPVHVYRRIDKRNVEIATDIPLYNVLHNSPNDYQTSYVFREAQQMRVCMWGNSYAQIVRNIRTGDVIGLLPLPSERVAPKLVNLKKIYEINGGEFILSDEDVLHIPGLGFDGIVGLSPIALMRRAIGQAMAQDEYGQSFYQNGTKLSGVLEHPSKLSPEVQGRLKASWSDTYAGRANAGKVAILEEGMKFNPLSMPMEDAQFVETRKFQVSEIARIFRVPLHMIADMSKSTFSNMEQMSTEFVRDTLLAWIMRWEQECNRKLLSTDQRGQYFIKFNLGGLLRGDLQSRYNSYKTGREGGWLSVNEIRELEDMNSIENGDSYLQPMNYQKLGGPDANLVPDAKEPAPKPEGKPDEDE